MRRARQTAAGIPKNRYVEWRALREIEVGVCDGMTYAQVRLLLVLLLVWMPMILFSRLSLPFLLLLSASASLFH